MTTQLIFFILIYLTIFALLPEYLSRRETHREPKTEIEDEAIRLARQEVEEIEYLHGVIEMPGHMKPAPIPIQAPRRTENAVCQTCIEMHIKYWNGDASSPMPPGPIHEVKNMLGQILYHYHEDNLPHIPAWVY